MAEKAGWPARKVAISTFDPAGWFQRGHEPPTTTSPRNTQSRHDMNRALKRALAHERGVAKHWIATASGYHPALPRTPLPVQRIPRTIVQVGKTFESAMNGKNRRYIQTWWTLNPEYAYGFFNDTHARNYIEARASADEVVAYLSLRQGAQRADVFRLVWMKYEGGVYADLDSAALNPMRTHIPLSVSAFTGQSWSFEFLAYEPRHPIIVDALKQVVHNVLFQVEQLKKPPEDRKDACRGAHRCVVSVTGPITYQAGVGEATHRLGCSNRGRVFKDRECSRSSDESMRNTHVCANPIGIRGNTPAAWTMTCNVSRHYDCRNGGVPGLLCETSLSNRHYTKVGLGSDNFYSVVPLRGEPGFPPPRDAARADAAAK